MPNFNENNIGFTKFCQENLKSHENMLQKYLCPMAFCPVSTPYKFYLVPNNRIARAYGTWLPKCALTDLSR
jgi:hypothetical protein